MSLTSHYSVGSNPFSLIVSAPTDVFTINGNDSNLVRILKLAISTTQTTTGINPWAIVKRSTPNSGGIAVNPVIVNFDSLCPAPTTVVTFYIEPPTLGTLVGSVKSFYMSSPALSDDGMNAQLMEFDFTDLEIDPLVLRGSNESLSFNFLGASLPGGFKVNAFVRWTEEID